MTTDARDLEWELNNLQTILRSQMANAKTPAEINAMGPRAVALTHEISNLIRLRRQLGIETNETLERAALGEFAKGLVQIITSELARLPDTTNWVHDITGITRSPEVAAAVQTWLAEFEDRFTVQENIARRIFELVSTLKNAPSN